MKQCISHWLHNTCDSNKNLTPQKKIIVSGLAVLLVYLLFLFAEKPTDHSIAALQSTYPSSTISLTSTKWWIKALPSSTAQHVGITPLESDGIPVGHCPASSSSNLQPGIYAYISLNPPMPNRLRSGAGKTYSYIGQIEPGTGVKVIGGPLCVDEYSWWLVETNHEYLVGWTAIGSKTEQWVIPCVNPNLPCDKTPASSITASTLATQDNGHKKCKSNIFTTGILAQVRQDNLLVIRSEPYTGGVIGHAGPMSSVKIVDGPHCAGTAIWWKVNILNQNLIGWATEANLRPCTKEDDCT